MLSGCNEYLEKAKSSISNQNYEDFLMHIGSAEALAKETGIYSEIQYTKAKGFFAFKKFGKGLLAIDEALKTAQDSRKVFKLLKAKGIILAYKGHFQDSLRLFKELLSQTDDISLLTEAYINISWVMLEEYKRKPNEAVMEEIKLYLDSAYENMDELNDALMERLILNNYAEYFKLKKDYEMAVEMLEKALPLFPESQLCEIYHSLAQLYMEQENMDLMEKYIQDAEILAARYDNDLVVAKILYTSAISKMNNGDYIKIMDSLFIAFHNFLACGSYSYAYDCFEKITEASNAFKDDCTTALREQFKSMFSDTAYTDLI